MCGNMSADGLALLNLLVGHGVWTKRLSLSVAVGITCFEGWTSMEGPSGLCSAMIAIWSLRRHFSVQLSPMDGSHGLPRSTSMGTRQPSEVCDCLVRKITVGSKWKCAHADISTTWLSRTIDPSNSDAPRCEDSSPFLRLHLLSRESNSPTRQLGRCSQREWILRSE